MRVQTVEELRAGEYEGTKKLKLVSCGLFEFPREILNLADSLEILDLSGNPLSQLPEDFHRLHNLKIAFFSDCRFAVFPTQLAKCCSLEMVAFRGNGMITIPEGTFPPQIRWLILTNNLIGSLPRSIGKCHRLQKAMLAGNRLTTLPDEMVNCKKLGLLRLSVNNITNLPTWLFSLPELAFLSFAGNPYASSFKDNLVLDDIAWSDLTINEMLGEGASGIISKGVWKPKTDAPESAVAIKLFKGSLTSDGSPADELIACITAGSHPNLINPIAKIHGHPEGKPGLVLQLIPPHYTNLGLPPTMQSCTRDSFIPGSVFSAGKCMAILRSVASAAAHLHAGGIAHGDLYAHNILIDEAGHALLGDFGAATIYRKSHARGEAIERLEVLAFGHLIEDLLGLVDHGTVDQDGEFLDLLSALHRWCTRDTVLDRPSFVEVCKILGSFRRF
jgi:Protein tyrosine and serine/threonine kinase